MVDVEVEVVVELEVSRAGVGESRCDAGRRLNAHIPHAVAPRLHHRHLNHHFRLGLVDVVDNFSRQQDAVRRVANHDGVLRVDLLHAPQIEQLPDAGHDFGEFLRQHGIVQIKRFYDFFFVILALLRLVRSHENNVGGHRAPERLALQRHDIQRLLQRHVRQLHGNAPRSEIRIEDHRQAGQFSDGIEHGLGVIGGLHVDRRARKRLNLRRPGHQLGLFCRCLPDAGTVLRRSRSWR